MYIISVETQFRASHQLTLQDGSKEPIHAHNWSLTANVSSDKLNNTGVVMDFSRLKTIIDKIVAEFDNKALNSIDYFHQNNPSAENVAKYIYEKLRVKLPKGVQLRNIRIFEERGCSAKFSD